jgi:MFS family permease
VSTWGLARRRAKPEPAERVPWKTLAPTVLAPNLLHGTGQGAVIPVIPLAAIDVGGTYATAAVAAAMLTVGQLVLALPAGSLVNRFNEKTAMLVAGVVTAVGGVVAFLASTLAILMVSIFVMGSGVAVFQLARHAWITTAVPVAVRGRSLSLVAGFNRLGMLAGPFIAAATIAAAGEVASAFITVVVTSALLVILVAFARFPAEDKWPEGDSGEVAGVLSTMVENRRVLATLGLLISVVSTMRTTRRIFVPLVGVALGMDAITISLIVGFSAAIDFSLFYVGGVIIDRLGRLWVAIPTLVIFGVTHLVIAVAERLPAGSIWFIAAAMLMAVGNGISAGLVATVGSDLADPRRPAAFLGSWRLVSEIGPSLAPLAIAGLIAKVSLGVGSAAAGGLAIFAAMLLPHYMRRYLPPSVR